MSARSPDRRGNKSPERRRTPTKAAVSTTRADEAGTSPAVAAVRDGVDRLGTLHRQARDVSKSYATQASALKRDLALVQRQIEFERERRKELERMMDIERGENVPMEHAEAVARRDDDIRGVVEEKTAMFEWLRRGVAEAQRISMECEALRERAESSHLTQAELRAEKDRLEQMERRLTVEVADAAGKIRRLSDAAVALEEHTDHQRSLLSVASDITRSAGADRQRLQQDVDELQKRAREVETIEIAVGCMAGSVRRALHTLERLQGAVENGSLAERLDDDLADDYDSEDDADNTRATSVVLTSTKAKMGRCEALLLTLHSTLKRFEHDERVRKSRYQGEFKEELTTAVDYLKAQKKRFASELAALEDILHTRDKQLRTAVSLRDQANRSETTLESFGELTNFSLTEYYEIENRKLLQEIDKLRIEQKRLEEKGGPMEGDYNAVRELRREYRELEARKLVLTQALRKEEEDQQTLKLALEDFGTSSGGKSASPSSKRRAPWRTTSSNA
jgi:DNA repair exonuclease SbcCD ATPase subunit